MELYDYNTVKRILSSHGFSFSKSLGQNFIIDKDVCPKMADTLNADKTVGVLEIGPGIGVLTAELCKRVGKVVAVELDKRLFPVLEETLKEFSNFELVEGDALKIDLNSLISDSFGGFSRIKICANLPYYITSPIIMKLLESRLPAEEIVVMVQKEAAQRLCAEVGTRESGAVTVAVNYYAKAEMLFEVDKSRFYPQPKIDSAVIKLSPREKPPVEIADEKRLFAIVKAAFSQRRKTALNCLSGGLGISKESVLRALSEIGVSGQARAESFSLEEFARLSEIL